MSDSNSETFWWTILVIVLTVTITSISFRMGYKAGQVDYANGIVKVELVTYSDNTKSWKYNAK